MPVTLEKEHGEAKKTVINIVKGDHGWKIQEG